MMVLQQGFHLGSYNFVGSKIHFTEPPLGDNTRVFDPETLIPKQDLPLGEGYIRDKIIQLILYLII